MEKRPILIVDDDPRVCEMVTAILEDVGFEVLSAPDGPIGIETAQAAQPAVILLDMMMPGLDGIVTCERLRADPVLADIPVVGITSSADLGYTEKAFAAGAQFFLTKPFGAGSLVQVVELALKSTLADTATRRHQHHPRFPAELPVWCLAGAEADTARGVMGYTKNLSLGGILLLLPEKLEPGTVLRLCLGLPEGPTTADGTVMWQTSFSTAEGGILHGIRLLRFAEAGGLVQYRSFLSQIAAHQAARTEA